MALVREVLSALIFDAAPDAILIVDASGRIETANPGALALFGYPEAELIGQPVEILIPKPLRSPHQEHRARFSVDPKPRSMGRRPGLSGLRKDGTIFPADISLTPVPTPGGLLTACIVRDLTERLELERSLGKRAEAVLDSSLDAYIASDRHARVLAWNAAAERIFGWSRDEALGKPLPELIIPPEFRSAAMANWDNFGEPDDLSPIVGKVTEQYACRRDGSVFPVEITVTAAGSGEDVVFHMFQRDISARKAAEAELLRYQQLVQASQDAMGMLDSEGLIVILNPAARELFGIDPAEPLGQPASIFWEAADPQDMQFLAGQLSEALSGQPKALVFSLRLRTGRCVTLSGRGAPIPHPDGSPAGIVFSLRDITDQAKAQQEVLASRERLQAIIDNTSAAVSVRDRDFRFLIANRAFAEPLGVTPADLIGRSDTDVLDPDDIAVSRVGDRRVLGGETLTEEHDVAGSGEGEGEVVHRTLLSQRFPLPGEDGQPYAIAEVATDITERKEAEEELRQRIGWEEYISRAVNEGRLLVYRQPIIDLKTGGRCQEELLVRMNGGHGPGDIVLPGEFLPQAERFGLMPTIDRFMLRAGIRLAEAGRVVSINLSPSSIRTVELAGDILSLISAAAPEVAANLVLEITEHAAFNSPEAVEALSSGLAALGCGLSLDDFGTGFGSFTELRRLNLSCLKIDTSFVNNLASDPEDQRVVKLIVHVAKSFGLLTTAEGVEDPEALQLLREYGVDRAQGYLIGYPEPVTF